MMDLCEVDCLGARVEQDRNLRSLLALLSVIYT